MRNTPCNIYSSFKARNSSTSSVWYLGIWVVLDVDSLVVVVVVVVGSLIFAVDVGPNVVLSSRLEIEKSGLLVLVVIPGISFGYCSVVVIGVVDVDVLSCEITTIEGILLTNVSLFGSLPLGLGQA